MFLVSVAIISALFSLVCLVAYFVVNRKSGFIELNEGGDSIHLCPTCAKLGNALRPFEGVPVPVDDEKSIQCFARYKFNWE